MLNGAPVIIADVTGTTADGTVTVPVVVGDRGVGSERTSAGKRARLSVIRTDSGGAAVVGNIGVYGVDLPDVLSGAPLGNAYATAPSTALGSQGFDGDGSTTVFSPATLLVPAAVGTLAAKDGVLVQTKAFKLTGTLTVSASGVITGSGTDFLGTTAAMVPALPELSVGDTVQITGTVNGVAGVTVTGTITAVTSSTAATWDQTVAIAATATGINTSVSKQFKLVLTSGAAGPRAVNLTSGTAGAAVVVTFIVAPPTSTVASEPGVIIYALTPTEIMAEALHMSEILGIRSRSVLWCIFGGIQTAANRVLVALEHIVD